MESFKYLKLILETREYMLVGQLLLFISYNNLSNNNIINYANNSIVKLYYQEFEIGVSQYES